MSQHEFSVQGFCTLTSMNLRSIKVQKLFGEEEVVLSLCPILLTYCCVQCWCPHMTNVKLLERDQRMSYTKKSGGWEINLKMGNLFYLSCLEKRYGMNYCSVWRYLHMEKKSEDAGQKELLVTLWTKAKQDRSWDSGVRQIQP